MSVCLFGGMSRYRGLVQAPLITIDTGTPGPKTIQGPPLSQTSYLPLPENMFKPVQFDPYHTGTPPPTCSYMFTNLISRSVRKRELAFD